MAQTVKLPDAEMERVRAEAALQSRSLSGQIVHWIRLGRAMERSPRFSKAQVEAALRAELSPDSLTGAEQAVWFEKFHEGLEDLAAQPGVSEAYAKLAEDPGDPNAR